MYRLTHNLFIFLACLFAVIKTQAQNVSSPYSLIGIGDIEDSYFNRTSGMANTGIAYRNNSFILLNNPAAISELQDQLFIIELSARGKFVNYSGKDVTTHLTGKDFSVERISMGMRINKWWGSSIGFMPFSTSNYAFSGTKSLQGTTGTLPVEYDGSGGINRYFFANGFRISKNLSVGVNTSFLGGSLKQLDSLLSPDLSTALYTTRNVYIRNLYLEYGLQYHLPVTKKWDINIGATYAQKTGLRAQTTALVKDNTGDTLLNRVLTNNYFTLPNTTGFGIALVKNKELTFLADYRFQDWSSLNIRGLNYSLENSSRYSAGVEYSKHKSYMHLSYEVFNLQAGVYYNKSYLKIYNQQLNDEGFTLGAGVNSKRSSMSYHLAFQYGMRGSQSLIKESYTSFTVGLSFKDFWNTKGKKYF
ncbi:MAG: hypothetical protein ABI416_08260 [Ginsengibacter sp.]